MDHGAIDAIFIILSSLGGIAGIVAAAGWAKAEHIRAERMGRTESASDTAQDSAVLAELKALKQQIAEMHSTSHQFDISFDEALSRMESRVGRLETKTAVGTAVTSDTPPTLRNGRGQ